jgi:hypothetical protein
MVNGSLMERPSACGSDLHRRAHGGVDRSNPRNSHRSNFNRIRGEFSANFPKICLAPRTAFSNVAGMVAFGE